MIWKQGEENDSSAEKKRKRRDGEEERTCMVKRCEEREENTWVDNSLSEISWNEINNILP